MGILAQPKQTVNEDSSPGGRGMDRRLELEWVGQAEKVLRVGRIEAQKKGRFLPARVVPRAFWKVVTGSLRA
jgi:hypothetical protein